METMKELPERCDHPLEFITLECAKEHQTHGGSYVSEALVQCHKCGKKFHLRSGYHSGWYRCTTDILDIIFVKHFSL